MHSPLYVIHSIWWAFWLLVQADQYFGEGIDHSALLQIFAEFFLL